MKKIGAIREILLTTRRPSKRISGRSLKSELSKTKLAIWRVAGSPSAITIEQSASRKAKISFTPSPVIATVRPDFLSV